MEKSSETNLKYSTRYSQLYLIPLLLNNALPVLDDVCKRSARFVFSCIQLDSSLVRSIAKHGIFEGRCNSVIGKNAAFLCSHFGWQLVNFVYSKTDLSNSGFLSYFYNEVSDTELCVRLSCLKMFFLLVTINLR